MINKIFIIFIGLLLVTIICHKISLGLDSISRNVGNDIMIEKAYDPNVKEVVKYSRKVQSISIELPNDINNVKEVNLGYVDFGEIIRIPWSLQNKSNKKIKLLGVFLDCACVGAEPKKGEIFSNDEILGYVDYEQETIGNTKRDVLFRTSVGDIILKIVSTKIRDHYVSPASINVEDSDFVIDFNSLYLKEKVKPSFHISEIRYDPNLLKLVGKKTFPVIERSFKEPECMIVYDESMSKINFEILPECSIGRYESEIKLLITDDSKKLTKYEYRVPLFLTVMKGLEINPTAVTLGWMSKKSSRFPIKRQVKLSGLKNRKIVEIKMELNDLDIQTSFSQNDDNVAIIDIIFNNINSGILKTNLFVFLIENDKDIKEKIIIPISGVIVE